MPNKGDIVVRTSNNRCSSRVEENQKLIGYIFRCIKLHSYNAYYETGAAISRDHYRYATEEEKKVFKLLEYEGVDNINDEEFVEELWLLKYDKFNLKKKKNETTRIITTESREIRKGSAISSGGDRQIASASRLIGNPTSAKYLQAGIDSVKIRKRIVSC